MGNKHSTQAEEKPSNKAMVSTCDELEKKLQDSDATPMVVPLEFLKTITRDFSVDLILGHVGFGVVYKGDLQCGKVIAVKKLNTPHLIEVMFRNEVRFLMGMRKHPNVVRFVGHCDESIPVVIMMDGKPVAADRLEKFLCFEYVPNDSLDKHISVNVIKFIERKQWFVAASRDGFVYVYNCRTGVKKITSFHAGEAYDFPVTSLAIHPTKPYVLSACREWIKLWDWDKNWECIQTWNELSDYSFHLTFNPKDTKSFASSSRDSTVKIWNLDSLEPKYMLSEHRYPVSCLYFLTRGDQQCLITGSYDKTVKIWDMQTKLCIYTLEGFMGCVKSVVSHPSIPVLITCTEDGDIHLWSATDFRLKGIVRIGGHGDPVMTCLVGPTRVMIVHDHLLSIMEIHDERGRRCYLGQQRKFHMGAH